MDGLNNFQVGFPSTFPVEGSSVDPRSYVVCGVWSNMPVEAGADAVIECTESDELFRYVIIQSLDTTAERLCLAEVGVYPQSQYESYAA